MFGILKKAEPEPQPIQAETVPQAEPAERRSEPRKTTLLHAFVSDRDGNTDVKCVIRNMSRSGCCIATSYIQDLPRIVDVLPEGFDKPLTGKIVWRKQKVAGIQFLSAGELEEFEKSTPVRESQESPGFFGKLFSIAGLYRSSGIAARLQDGITGNLPRFSQRALYSVRQPLRAIQGMLGLLLSDAIRPIPQRAKTILKNANENAEKAEHLLDEALRADQLDAPGYTHTPEPVDICAIVGKCALMNTGFAARYDVRFEIKDSVGKAMVHADTARIEEALTNLLSSAARFSPVGEMITICVTRHEGNIRVGVTDRGMGSNVAHGDAGGKPAHLQDDDSGIGLPVARAILGQHGATLHIDAKPGHGTTHWFELRELV